MDEHPKDLEERTAVFAEEVRKFVAQLPRTVGSIEDVKQFVRSSGSVAANRMAGEFRNDRTPQAAFQETKGQSPVYAPPRITAVFLASTFVTSGGRIDVNGKFVTRRDTGRTARERYFPRRFGRNTVDSEARR